MGQLHQLRQLEMLPSDSKDGQNLYTCKLYFIHFLALAEKKKKKKSKFWKKDEHREIVNFINQSENTFFSYSFFVEFHLGINLPFPCFVMSSLSSRSSGWGVFLVVKGQRIC